MTIKVPTAISWANGIIMANKLGNQRARDARAGWDAALILCTILTFSMSIFTYIFRFEITQFLAPKSRQNEIHNAVVDTLPYLAIYMIVDQVQRTGQGAIRGMGMQKYGAMANVLSYYVIGIPIGLFLCFYCHFKVKGLWIGMSIAAATSSLGFIIIRTQINWQKQVKNALKRIKDKEKSDKQNAIMAMIQTE